jgi:hypothetical protein
VTWLGPLTQQGAFLRACGWEVRWEGDEGDMNNVCILRPGYDKDVPKPDGAGSTHLSMDQNAVGGSDWGVGFRSYNVDQANKQEGLDCTRGALDVVAEFFDECMLDVTKSERTDRARTSTRSPKGAKALNGATMVLLVDGPVVLAAAAALRRGPRRRRTPAT